MIDEVDFITPRSALAMVISMFGVLSKLSGHDENFPGTFRDPNWSILLTSDHHKHMAKLKWTLKNFPECKRYAIAGISFPRRY